MAADFSSLFAWKDVEAAEDSVAVKKVAIDKVFWLQAQ